MANIQVRTSDIVKDLASEIFEEYGLELTAAIRLFLKKTIAEGKIPFEAKYDKMVFDKIIFEKEQQILSSIGNDEDKLLNLSNDIISEVRAETKENSGK